MSPSRRIAPWPWVMRVRILRDAKPRGSERAVKANGGHRPGLHPEPHEWNGASREVRRWCGMPSGAPRRWRGSAMGTSRPTAKPHEGGRTGEGALRWCASGAHGRCARWCGMPRRAPRWRGGGGEGAREAKPRTAPMARRRDGDIAPYRQAARGRRPFEGIRAVCAGNQAAHRGGEPPRAMRRGGAMGTSRPTATGHGRRKWRV